MDEKLMHRRLRRTAVIIVLISLLQILLEGIAMISLQKNLNETIKQRITGEAEEYQGMIMDQIYANLQLLNTLASFIRRGDLDDQEYFARRIDEANKSNDFISMMFIGCDGLNILSTLGQPIQVGFNRDKVGEEVSQLIDRNMNGEMGVSQMYPSKVVDATVFVYGVPVYDEDGNMLGSLLASDNIDVFFDMLNGSNVLCGAVVFLLVNQDG